MSNILTLNGVNAYYGSSHILFGVDLAVEKGRSACILGRNGVGKSTTMKTICGAMNPKNHARTEGSIRFGDKELVGMSPYQIAQAGIAYVPQGRHIFSDLTTQENLLIARKKGPNGEQKWTLERIYELFPRLKERENSMGNKLSGGEQQMLTVARGLMQNPTMILLDEITEGLAPIVVDQLAEIVSQLRKMNVSILVAEQSVKFALAVSDDCYILEKGNVVLHKPTAELTHEEILKYLGT